MFRDGRRSLSACFSREARLLPRTLLTAAALCAVALGAPGGASADNGATWHCRGSAQSVATPIPIAGLSFIEPVVANGQTNPNNGQPSPTDQGAVCTNTDAGTPTFAFPPTGPSNVSGRS